MKGDFTRWSFKPEKHYHGVLKQQGRVDLDAEWNEQGAIKDHRIETETLDVVGPTGAPVGNAGFMLTPSGSGASLSISAGRAYVDGILCENDQPVLITAQPDLPGFKLPTAAGNYIAYLEVWLRHITALDDDGIRESALGGPDTCTRARTICQVGLLPVKQSGIDCSTATPEWTALTAASTGTLAARAQPDASTADPCLIPAKAGYRRLENQLYRVEVHDASGGKNTFKWSRDNGSVATSWLPVQPGQATNTLRVASSGLDAVLAFAAGQWVELTDDVHDLNFVPGTLVQLTNVAGNILTYDATSAIPAGPITYPVSPDPTTYPDIHPRIRRWDSAGVLPVTAGAWSDLEDGVQVNFSTGTFSNGDYWVIPARTLKADVEWPVDNASNPVAKLPNGIHRHFCKLAIAQLAGTSWSISAACLPTFPSLTNVGSGQDKGIHITEVRTAIPDAPLLNDSVLFLDTGKLEDGFTIRIICDAPVDPVSAQPTTCFLILDLPYPYAVGNFTPSLLFGFQPLVVPATIRIAASASGGSEILLILGGQPFQFIPFVLAEMSRLNLGSRLLARLRLKGNFIWGRDDATLFLDGDAFGIMRKDADGSSHIGSRLPKSGDGRRGGDFEMWFWFGLPITVASLVFDPATINSGQPTTGTVTLSSATPAGGAVVELSNNSPNVLSLPASVTVPEGQTSVAFPVSKTQLPPGIPRLTVQATAAYAGGSTNGNLIINAVVAVVGVALAADSIPGGTGVFGTVALNVPAGPNGESVFIASNNASVKPQSPVLVKANELSAQFEITTTVQPTNMSITARITASLGNSNASASLTLTGGRPT
jgi:hypothetical protein